LFVTLFVLFLWPYQCLFLLVNIWVRLFKPWISKYYLLSARDYGKVIVAAKKKHWADFLEEASDRDLWTSNHYLKDPIGDGGKSRIPVLKVKEDDGTTREIASNNDKVEVFHKVFFPPKSADSSIPRNYWYSEPLPPPSVIGKTQI
jgi:hypothetical protein